MVLNRTYGSISFNSEKDVWVISEAEPHVCIKLKSVFSRIPKYQIVPFELANIPDVCHDLAWFMDRYPLGISQSDRKLLVNRKQEHITALNELEKILVPDYKPEAIHLRDGEEARDYQVKGGEVAMLTTRILIGDDLGLGKSLTSIIPMITHSSITLPAVVVVQSHLANQWKERQLERFTNLKVHIIKQRKLYNLPPADVYILKYSLIVAWTNIISSGIFKYCVYDEVQELRHDTTDKYKAAQVLSANVQYCVGLSATPIYNYGNEIFNVLDIIKKGCMGEKWDFIREWTGNRGKVVIDPKALGTYLKENFLFLRRTRAEVGRELPRVNKLLYTVGYDQNIADSAEELARQLSITVLNGASFEERGQAARELSIYVRHQTGISKAKYVAEFVKIILENNEPLILAGWHRDVYDIWLDELKEYSPVMFTGSESEKQKNEAVKKFTDGETNLFILSLRSGAGLDGLQYRCKTVVFGELDHSPKVHDQLVGRVDRDGQVSADPVTAIFLTSDFGSDPEMINRLGLKASQSHGIVNPLLAVDEKFSDESWIKQMAERFLSKKKEIA